MLFPLFFFNDTATTEIYTLSLHDALPIFSASFFGRLVLGVEDAEDRLGRGVRQNQVDPVAEAGVMADGGMCLGFERSEEHTSELQSLAYLVCRLLLEKKKRICYFPVKALY